MAQPASKRLVTEANITDPNSVAGAAVVSAASQTADSRIAAGLASGGVIKAADDATLSAAKSYADSGVAQINTWFRRGNGSPIGVITPSSAGVQYVDLLATNGARVWISTGNANTSWRVVEGDTGLRDVTTLITFPSVVTAEKVFLSRIGQFCILSIKNMTLSAAYSGALSLGLPPGFRPFDSNNRYYNGKARIDVYQSGDGWLADTAGTSFVYMTWATRNAWPTTLPGTPA